MKSEPLTTSQQSLLKQGITPIIPGHHRVIISNEISNENPYDKVGWVFVLTNGEESSMEKIGQFNTFLITRLNFPGSFKLMIADGQWLFNNIRIEYYSKNGFMNGQMACPFISERKDKEVLWTSGVVLADIEVEGTVHERMIVGYISEVIETIAPPPHTNQVRELRDHGADSIPLMVSMSYTDYDRVMKELSDKKKLEKMLKSTRSQLSRLRRNSKKIQFSKSFNIN